MRIVNAGIAYFALVFGAGFVLGAVRVLFLMPHLGARMAELLEMPIMFLVMVVAARFVVSRFRLPPSARARLSTGFLALALLLAAEFALVVLLQEQSLSQYIASRDPVSGSVYLALLVLFAAMPLIQARVRRGSEHRALNGDQSVRSNARS